MDRPSLRIVDRVVRRAALKVGFLFSYLLVFWSIAVQVIVAFLDGLELVLREADCALPSTMRGPPRSAMRRAGATARLPSGRAWLLCLRLVGKSVKVPAAGLALLPCRV